MQKYLLAGIGGFFGAAARLWVGTVFDQRLGTRFPYGTFVINMSGCLLIGLLLSVMNEKLHINPAWRYLLPVGFVGAYTTFSTFEYETFMGVHNGNWAIALLYLLLSIVVGFTCVWLGVTAGKALV